MKTINYTNERKESTFFASLWVVLRVNLPVILILIFGLYATIWNSQAKDFLVQLSNTNVICKTQVYSFIACLGIWCITITECSKLLISGTPISLNIFDPELGRQTLRRTARFAPYILAGLPPLAISLTFLTKNGLSCNIGWMAISPLIFVGCMAFYNYRKSRLPGQTRVRYYEDLNDRKPLPELLRSNKLLLRLLLFYAIIIVLCIIDPVARELVDIQVLKPTSVVCLGTSILTSIITLLSHYNSGIRVPVFMVLLVYLGLCSRINNNHSIGNLTLVTHQNPGSEDPRLSINEDFINWFTELQNTKYASKLDTIPIFIVANQGGGIRGMAWSANVLHNIQALSTNKQFYKHVYAMTGASGGCLGMIEYNMLYAEGKSNNMCIDQIMEYDYLTPTLTSFLMENPVQSILPFPISGLDRGRVHANTFEDGFSKATGEHTLNSSLLNYYAQHADTLPRLFINGALMENGQKVIYSTVKLNNTYFKNDIDLLDTINLIQSKFYDLQIKDAMMVCCRFPYILPGGVIPNPDNNQEAIGSIIDGGYIENTGIETAIQIACNIQQAYNEYKATLARDSCTVTRSCTPSKVLCDEPKIKPIKIHIVYIQNGNYKQDTTTVFNSAKEVLTPIIGGLNSQSEGAERYSGPAIEMLLANAGLEYEHFLLPRFNDAAIDKGGNYQEYPLGWYISDTAYRSIAYYAKNLNRTWLDTTAEYKVLNSNTNNLLKINNTYIIKPVVNESCNSDKHAHCRKNR